MRNVLVVYINRRHPQRAAILDHLGSYGRWADARVFYLNLGLRRVPGYLRRVPFDLVLFHHLFLGARWKRSLFDTLVQRAAPIRQMPGVKAALAQDEFFDTRSVEAFCNGFGIDHLFSVAPESEWERLYPDLTRSTIRFHRVLTGYLERETLARIDALSAAGRPRPIDVGYRAMHVPLWLGRHGLLKVELARRFSAAAAERGLTSDVSTAVEDTLLGDDWFRHLSASRFTFGAEGGASILDRDGALRDRFDAWSAENPEASYDEAEAACFPGRDGEIDLRAISPRHLEACATRTGQALVEGDYNGILEGGRHYLPLKPDFSNLGEVADALRDEALRQRLVETAHREVVAPGRWGYEAHVKTVIETALADAPDPAPELAATRRAWRLNQAAEAATSAVVRASFPPYARLSGLAARESAAVPAPVRRRDAV